MTTKPSKEFHDEYEVTFHAAENVDEHFEDRETWAKRHQDKVLDEYCDIHPSAPECKVFDEWGGIPLPQRDLQIFMHPYRSEAIS